MFVIAILALLSFVNIAYSTDYYDDFESNDMSNYSISFINPYYQDTVAWDIVSDGSLVLQGEGGTSAGGGGSVAYITNFDDANIQVEALTKIHEVRNMGHFSGIVARYIDPSHYYCLIIRYHTDTQASYLVLHKRNGGYQTLNSISFNENWTGIWKNLKLEICDNKIKAYLNDILYFDIVDETPLGSGSVGFINGGAITRYDNFNAKATNCELVAHWSFDDSNDLGYDDSGNGHNGTVNGEGDEWIQEGLGCIGALSLDGEGDYLQIPYSPALDVNGWNEGTLSAWFKVNSFQSNELTGVIYRDIAGGDRSGISIRVYYDEQSLLCEWRNGNSSNFLYQPDSVQFQLSEGVLVSCCSSIFRYLCRALS